jgi:hypothetical protein
MATVAAMPARANAVTNLPVLLVGSDGDNVADDFMSRNPGVSRGQGLVDDSFVAIQSMSVVINMEKEERCPPSTDTAGEYFCDNLTWSRVLPWYLSPLQAAVELFKAVGNIARGERHGFLSSEID